MPSEKRSGQVAPTVEDSAAAGPAPPAQEPPDPWKSFQGWIWKHFGWPGLIVVLVFAVGWSQWDHISKLPGIELLVARISEKSLPPAEPGRFNVAIAHLVGDDDHSMEQVIRDSLRDRFPIVNTMSFDRMISSEQGEREGHERARALLKASGFDVMIWGDYLKKDDKSLPRLHLTISRDEKTTASAGRYQMTEDLNLPPLFWQNLTDVLGLLVATSDAEFAAHPGQYQADKLAPFIQRVQKLLADSSDENWNAGTRAKVQAILGNALVTYGEQSGKSEPLQEAVTTYQKALTVLTREKMSRDWATTQDNLGWALLRLGQRESGTARLQEAEIAFRAALKERTREKVPLDWAMTQHELAYTLETLGERESGTAQLQEAETAYREALKERTREKAPRAWAATQNNLGNTLAVLGERESGTARLQDAVTAYREALKELTLEKTPLDWAMAQDNLGNVFQVLGEREADLQLLQNALTAHREALRVYNPEMVPLEWAMTQSNLGVTLESLGEIKSDPSLLREAAHAFQSALVVFRAEKASYYISGTENSLQRVQKTLDQKYGTQAARD